MRDLRKRRPDRSPAPSGGTVPVSVFDAAYAGTERFMGVHEEGKPPWEIGGPQPAIVASAEAGAITGRVLDVGCGTGENALYLAARGHAVVGVDASTGGIARAQSKLEHRDLPCRFLVADALELAGWDERFDTVIDSGFLHLLSEADCARLVAGLHHVLRRGGRHHLVCFSRRKPLPAPRRLSRHDIAASFGRGWRLERLVECRYEVLDGLHGRNAWRASLVRL